MTTSVGNLLGRRRATKPSPMAVPLDPDAHKPLGVRLAEWVQGIVTRRLSVAGQRVVSWTLHALCVGALGIAYLVQTSYVASVASKRAALESTTTAVQDANARLTAQVAEAQAIGKAEPAARAQGLQVAPASSVAYLTAPNVTEPTVLPTAIPTVTPNPPARIRASLLGQASVDAPSPAAAGAAATAEATNGPAALSGLPPMARQPIATPKGGK